jgi:hypothetical protein
MLIEDEHKIMFSFSVIYRETITQDITSELWDTRLELSKFWIKVCSCSCNDLPPGALCPETGDNSTKMEVCPVVSYNQMCETNATKL